jgi:hypothetical protein
MSTVYYWMRSIIRKVLGLGIEIYEVCPGLFQASSFTQKDWPTITKLGIEVIVDLEGDVDKIPDVKIIYWPIKDEAKLPDLDHLHSIAVQVVEYLNQGKKVMVHCSLGKNRSGLVIGVVLVSMGMLGKDAVKLIQSKVPGSLFNPTFREYLETL